MKKTNLLLAAIAAVTMLLIGCPPTGNMPQGSTPREDATDDSNTPVTTVTTVAPPRELTQEEKNKATSGLENNITVTGKMNADSTVDVTLALNAVDGTFTVSMPSQAGEMSGEFCYYDSKLYIILCMHPTEMQNTTFKMCFAATVEEANLTTQTLIFERSSITAYETSKTELKQANGITTSSSTTTSTTTTTIQGYVGRVYTCQTVTFENEGNPSAHSGLTGIMVIKFTKENEFTAFYWGKIYYCQIAAGDISNLFTECSVTCKDSSGNVTDLTCSISMARDYSTARVKMNSDTYDMVADGTAEEYSDKLGLAGTRYYCRELTCTITTSMIEQEVVMQEQITTEKLDQGDVIEFIDMGGILTAHNHFSEPPRTQVYIYRDTADGEIVFFPSVPVGAPYYNGMLKGLIASDGSSIDFSLVATYGNETFFGEEVESGTYVKIDSVFNLCGKTYTSTSDDPGYSLVFDNSLPTTFTFTDDSGSYEGRYYNISDAQIAVLYFGDNGTDNITGSMTISADRKNISFALKRLKSNDVNKTINFVLQE